MRALLAAGLLVVATAAPAKPPEYFAPDPPGLPFAEAVQVGDLLFLSGRIGTMPGTRTVVPGGIDAETKQVMENIGEALRRRGLGYDSLVKCTAMLADMKDWPAFNAIYATYFRKGHYPARSAFGANGLALGARVEVECWAYAPNK